MDSVEARPMPLLTPYQHSSPQLSLAPHNSSPQLDKSLLISKILHCQSKNAELEAKQQSLHNTISDLRKLMQSASQENEEYILHTEDQQAKLSAEAARLRAGLRFAHRDGRHLANCALYWRQFVI